MNSVHIPTLSLVQTSAQNKLWSKENILPGTTLRITVGTVVNDDTQDTELLCTLLPILQSSAAWMHSKFLNSSLIKCTSLVRSSLPSLSVSQAVALHTAAYVG